MIGILILFGPKVPIYCLAVYKSRFLPFVLVVLCFYHFIFHLLMQTHLHIGVLF